MGETIAKPGNNPKLDALRAAMGAAAHSGGTGVDAFLVPSEDPHMSEYAPDCDNRRAFISGFDGSAGTAVITTSEAALWTDGRYFLQAEQQLGPGWRLMKGGVPGTPEISEWLIATLPKGARVGIDPFLHTMESARKLGKDLAAKGLTLVPLFSGNLVDGVWGDTRPAPPAGKIEVHAMEWAGASVKDKVESLSKEVKTAGADSLLVTMLDEIAWCVNLRGADVECNPVFVSYLLLKEGKLTLYVDSKKLTPEAEQHLRESEVEVKAYEQLLEDIKVLAAGGGKIAMDPAKVSYAVERAALDAAAKGTKRKVDGEEVAGKAEIPVVEATSPISMAKAIKNEAEMKGMVEAHLRDGVAVAKFLCFLEEQMAAGATLTEVDVDTHITGLRAKQAGFKQPSFPTIAGEGPNGAVIHYRAAEGTCRTVTTDSMLLIDSGGQYDCGTTDVTRTVHTGTPSAHQIATFTAVLKGNIALTTAVFPPGTPGIAIDAMARAPLWAMGLNYRHGTGHGVGAALNVHEGPHSISTRYWNTTPLKTGMIVSNEPGYYEDGAFGIRIEHLLQIVDAQTEHRFGDETYMTFLPLTLIPIQRKLIDTTQLLPHEVAWIDGYHARVWEEISPRLADDPKTTAWLQEATAPLST